MGYNSAGYNSFALNTTGVFESGSTTAVGLLATTEASIGSESGTTQSSGVVRSPTDTSYNAGAYNRGVYNTENGGEIALAFEDGVTDLTGQLNVQESTNALEVGTTTSTERLNITDLGLSLESGTTTTTTQLRLPQSDAYQTGYNVDGYNAKTGEIAFGFESGLVESSGLIDVTTDTIPAIVRVYARDVLLDIAYTLELNTTFTLTRIIEFTESNTMTEIPEIDDTITNETRLLKFTAKEDGNVKDITGASVSWSLVDKDGVVLDETDAEVDVTITDPDNGRFNVEVDTFDTGAGVYRQRVEIEDSQGRISRSNGVYRLQEF